jgi:hypothetical protein
MGSISIVASFEWTTVGEWVGQTGDLRYVIPYRLCWFLADRTRRKTVGDESPKKLDPKRITTWAAGSTTGVHRTKSGQKCLGCDNQMRLRRSEQSVYILAFELSQERDIKTPTNADFHCLVQVPLMQNCLGFDDLFVLQTRRTCRVES